MKYALAFIVACLMCDQDKARVAPSPNRLPPVVMASADGDVNGDGKTTSADIAALETKSGERFLVRFSARLTEIQKARFPTWRPEYAPQSPELRSLGHALIRQIVEAESVGKVPVLVHYGGEMNSMWTTIDTKKLRAIQKGTMSFIMNHEYQRWELAESALPVHLAKETS